jgi:hypothetical protein
MKINGIIKVKINWVGKPKNSAAARTKGRHPYPGTGIRPPTMREGEEGAGGRGRAV